MTLEPNNKKQVNIEPEYLYETAFITLIKNVKQSIASQKIEECITILLKMGYNRQELIMYINKFLKDE